MRAFGGPEGNSGGVWERSGDSFMNQVPPSRLEIFHPLTVGPPAVSLLGENLNSQVWESFLPFLYFYSLWPVRGQLRLSSLDFYERSRSQTSRNKQFVERLHPPPPRPAGPALMVSDGLEVFLLCPCAAGRRRLWFSSPNIPTPTSLVLHINTRSPLPVSQETWGGGRLQEGVNPSPPHSL